MLELSERVKRSRGVSVSVDGCEEEIEVGYVVGVLGGLGEVLIGMISFS